MPEVNSIGCESHPGPHSLTFMSGHLSNCAWRCRTKARFISQDYPGPKAWYPLSIGLPCLAYKVRPDPIRTCLSFFQMVLRSYANIKSSSGEERQIWEYLERRGGRVGHPDQLRDGSNTVAAASPAPPGPKNRVSHEGCEYPETPVKTSLQTNADVQDHALPSTS